MSTEQQPIDAQTIEDTKQQIRGLIGEITTLSRQELDPQVFYGEFLQRVVAALAAVGGAIWTLRGGNELMLNYQMNIRQAFPDSEQNGVDQTRHSKLLYRVVRTGEHLLVPPYSGAAGDDEAGNPTALLLVLVPIRDDEKVAGIIEVFQRPSSNPASQRGYLNFVGEMAQHFGQYLRSRRLRELTDWQTLFSEVDRFSRIVHENLDPKTTAYTIANEGRRLIGCDRVSVAIKRGRKCRVEAVSGQDTMDMRSNAVVQLSKLATAVVRSGEPLWYTGSDEDLPPQIEDAVHDYVDEAHTKTVAVLPLKKVDDDTEDVDDPKRRRQKTEHQVVGALILEQIEDSRPASDFTQSLELVSQHSSRALANAMDHHGVFLMPLWKSIGRAKWLVQARTLPKTLAVLAGILLLAAVLIFVKKDFNMEARGELQPRIRQNVFADVDGTVEVVEVKHGQEVQQGDLLVQLDNPDLDNEMARIDGDLLEATKQYAEFDRMLTDRNLEQSELQNLRLELLRVRERKRSLESQREILQRQIDALTITSPINGLVTTWDVQNLLLRRPVSRGNVLVELADPSGPWQLEIYMEEDRMGHVRRAIPKSPGEAMKVTYILASNPKLQLQGELFAKNIHRLAQLHDEYGHSVRLVVDVNKDDLVGAQLGTEVTAKVYCGRRSIGYAWFHELIEFLQTNVFF